MTMTTPREQAAWDRLATLIDPGTGQSWVASKQVQSVQETDGRLVVALTLGYPAASQWPALQAELTAALGADEVRLSTRVVAHAVQRGLELIPGVKNLIVVGSGKGGVGKSTTAANLALALQAEGARVGLLDADIYGPSVPTMLGAQGQPSSPDGKSMEPLSAHGLQLMSIGFLVAQDQATIWRGPMATQALEQLLRQTRWDDLDYLVVDLPPGTGDIQLTLAQRVPVTGAVIVTTPQDVALLDARKAARMFEKVSVPMLGLVENMSVFCCPNCGHSEPIFGADGGKRLAEELGLPFLGELPLLRRVRELSDAGMPPVVAEPASEVAQRYRALARQVGAAVAQLGKDYSSKLPKVVKA
ncbi:iron-sulfur cluster carrier protein ApbC [Inhella gelatinilytica]|uniref:Iron-sulfur cluster carrier protein n=1 Tax=Inhella gelatinilytica TaxID=2795030 RepID=A0A931IZH1_9BURK|nr:iron-sulfur cluster carrier protein ApbC [Inhella gelatinilytica]MBH9552646.1 iron-sulfur cluster carrier protein ApbC [Inhella gelatinilytica]